mmetsp:Transcript_48126/g.136728  ORF Transcript_48126/g.136728 Transcript_48126/m.136728 type:complete len:557 (-) Transcript_48126:58-1728(-)
MRSRLQWVEAMLPQLMQQEASQRAAGIFSRDGLLRLNVVLKGLGLSTRPSDAFRVVCRTREELGLPEVEEFPDSPSGLQPRTPSTTRNGLVTGRLAASLEAAAANSVPPSPAGGKGRRQRGGGAGEKVWQAKAPGEGNSPPQAPTKGSASSTNSPQLREAPASKAPPVKKQPPPALDLPGEAEASAAAPPGNASSSAADLAKKAEEERERPVPTPTPSKRMAIVDPGTGKEIEVRPSTEVSKQKPTLISIEAIEGSGRPSGAPLPPTKAPPLSPAGPSAPPLTLPPVVAGAPPQLRAPCGVPPYPSGLPSGPPPRPGPMPAPGALPSMPLFPPLPGLPPGYPMTPGHLAGWPAMLSPTGCLPYGMLGLTPPPPHHAPSVGSTGDASSRGLTDAAHAARAHAAAAASAMAVTAADAVAASNGAAESGGAVQMARGALAAGSGAVAGSSMVSRGFGEAAAPLVPVQFQGWRPPAVAPHMFPPGHAGYLGLPPSMGMHPLLPPPYEAYGTSSLLGFAGYGDYGVPPSPTGSASILGILPPPLSAPPPPSIPAGQAELRR